MTAVKDLYLGKCIEDLIGATSLPDIKDKPIKQLCKSALTLFAEAENQLKTGDEERAYILFMKYFMLLSQIQQMPSYNSFKKDVANILGSTKKQTDAMDQLEILTLRLKERYATLNEQRRLLSQQLHTLVVEQPTIREHKETSKKIKTSITPMDLYERIQNPSNSILIMDCRPKQSFSDSHMFYQFCFNVPEENFKVGMSASKVMNSLPDVDKRMWASRSVKEYLILMDWSSFGPEPTRNSPIFVLKDILENWDNDVTYKNPIMIVDGGYERFVLMYPSLTTNPKPIELSLNKTSHFVLDDIEYPSLNDISMKEDIFSSANKENEFLDLRRTKLARPDINRDKKPNTLKQQNGSVKVEDIIEEREKLAEKSLRVEEERLEAEAKWHEAETDNKQDEEKQALLYKILQLENTQRDNISETDQLRKQLEFYKAKVNEFQSRDTVFTDREAELEKKEAQRKQLDEQRARLAEEREKKLAFARETKRHLDKKTNDVEDESLSRAKIPQFDRSVKPPQQPYVNYANIQRDFSPVAGNTLGPGLTGLKNLGNTCYMNSIIQCLSNTTFLTEYLLNDLYRKHINRNSKTQGRIVEEIAALLKVLWSGHYKYVSPYDLKRAVGQYKTMFMGYEQQDSHEFLTILMDLLQLDLQTIIMPDVPKESLSASERAWREYTKGKESQLSRMFYGQIKSTVKCVDCSKESATYECFSNLSLELPPTRDRCKLENCLDMYFNGERIKGWNCPNCKDKREAIKKLDISKLPPVLVIHFKRFYADLESTTSAFRKKQIFIHFSLNGLDLTPYIAPSEIRRDGTLNRSYDLYAISNHYGSMESGHYTAYCKNMQYKKWFKYDDLSVSPLDASDVCSSAAYILFYTNKTAL